MNINMNNAFGAMGLMVGICGIGYAYGCQKKTNQLAEKLDTSINELMKKTNIDIPESLIETAVKDKVKHEAEAHVRIACCDAIKEVKSGIIKEVKEAVNDSYVDIKSDVASEITKQVADIDISELRRQVKRDAAEKIADRLDTDLEGICDKYNSDLDNVRKIYASIAKSITG